MDAELDRPPETKLGPLAQGAARSLAYLTAHAGKAASILAMDAFIGAMLAFAGLIVKTVEPEDSDKVLDDWQRAVASLGLNAVFPPNEELQVGDILAVEYKRIDDKVFMRTIHMARAPDIKTYLRDAYKDAIRFPPTPPDYDGKSPVMAEKDIYADNPDLRSLSIVAFPDVVFSSSTTQAVSGFVPFLRQLFSAQRTSEDSVEVKIPYAETYGLPSAYATSVLDHFCVPDDEKPTVPLCTEDYMKRELSSVPWHRIFVGLASDKLATLLPKEEREGGLYLRFVRRVVLTRKIEYAYGSNTVLGELLKGAAPAPGAADNTPPAAGEPGAKVRAEVEKTTQALGATGADARIGVAGGASGKVALSVVLARPLVIGYEGITAKPFPVQILPAKPVTGAAK